MKSAVLHLLLPTLIFTLSFASCKGDDGKYTEPLIVNPGQQEEEEKKEEESTADYNEPKTGSAMTAWVKGFLDIHFINTTAGECIFMIFPDGTQMLIDAAGSTVATGIVSGTIGNTGIRKRWDPTKTNTLYGEFIADYLKKCMVWTGNDVLDFVLNTHFHADHFGGADNLPSSTNSSTYVQSSMAYILDNFKVGLLMDRGYPDYNYPYDQVSLGSNNVKNYIAAVRWHTANKGLKAELFRAGAKDQIYLKKDAASYPTFNVRNLAVNGNIWTGSDENTRETFPKASEIASPSAGNCPPENTMSAMLKVNYGSFGFASLGDAQYNGRDKYPWKDIETPVCTICGEAEIMKADHHGSVYTNGTEGVSYINPQCWVVNGWTDAHPRQAIFETLVGNFSADAYFTNLCSDMQKYPSYVTRVKGGDGHIVVRVRPGGASYNVYVLTDSDRKMTVKYASPSYKCR